MRHTTRSNFHTKEGLKREIGIWGLTSNIINVVIGSGIFVLPALVSQGLGAAGILAYLFCGFLITIIMLCFAEVGSKVTLTGGAYAYIEAAFGEYFGFLTTNLFIFGASLMATAAVANALADTLSYLLPVFKEKAFRAVFFLILFSGLTIVNVRGVKKGITLVKLTTIAKLAPLLLLVIWGSTQISLQNLKWDKVPSLSSFGSVSLILFFAFQGAENGLSVSGEVQNPKRTIPRAIFLSLLVIILLYIAVQLVAQGILGDAFPRYKAAPLAEVAKRIMGPFGATLMILGACISMFGYLSGDILNMPRVLFRSAKDGVIPIRALALIHPRFSTPYVSVIAFTTLGCLLAITGEFKQLAILSSSSVLLIYLGVALAVIKLRIKDQADSPSFKIPGGYLVPVLAIITILVFLSNLTKAEILGMLFTLVVLTLLFYLLKYLKTLRARMVK
ncbi:APC family permease [Dyadobacter sp. LJ53]|uniref:APC family permease n=1 Tax=Dyadobacter chenwenxiniae TaxID=2906456 RepID=UPI001F1AFA0A|nr:amino acid permease [Dyadobacter chenwenxiniae]MCF0048999.1 APC family permease [Dyadobacter chenwenxiniae]